MRVVSGSARGLRLLAPPGTSVRPTADRVREAVFNSLGSLGAVQGASVLDVFAGSGALGIEALSRGAKHCIFCEVDPGAVRVLRENLWHTRTDGSADVVVGDTMALLSNEGLRGSVAVDLVLADPPYAFERWGELLDLLEPTGAQLVVAESDRPIEATPRWREVRQRAYGGTIVTILERSCGLDPKTRHHKDPHPSQEHQP
ncbi:MAG: 16S rRNA (guanine(966)-N(2))-methyltransferase RsmD [Microthrixaceae bacterium]|nr:16S rRNA (guanine(966)-N(2))-methyltransferase RsmD [Microthrixaceae bacterium]